MTYAGHPDHGGPSTRTWLHQVYGSTPAHASFWQLAVADPGPAHLFDWPVYQRGAMALAALRQRIGHPVFAHLLRAWTAQRFHGHGTTGGFQALELSGQDLTSFFDAWVRQATKPARHGRQRPVRLSRATGDELGDPALAARSGPPPRRPRSSRAARR